MHQLSTKLLVLQVYVYSLRRLLVIDFFFGIACFIHAGAFLVLERQYPEKHGHQSSDGETAD